MYDESEVFEELTSTASNQRELALINKYITGEKCRSWIQNTKEGQAINAEIQYLYSRALDSFESCDPTDDKAIAKAKFDLSVAKRIFEIFNGIFQDADMAEQQLSGD